MNVTLVVPAYNEEESIQSLFQLAQDFSNLHENQVILFLIENGSLDSTRAEIEKALKVFTLLKTQILKLDSNEGYGGAVKKGISMASTDLLMILPADGKYRLEDLDLVYQKYRFFEDSNLLVKGSRVIRNDPKSIQFLSLAFSFMVRILFRVSVKDVNGLPKIFDRSRLSNDLGALPDDATFDAGLLQIWKSKGGKFHEIPVHFIQQNMTSTSWARKRLKVSLNLFVGLLKIFTKKRLVFTKVKNG